MTTATPVSCGPNVSISKFITVSPVGLVSPGVIAPNNGADYGPDTPGTQTSGIQEAINAGNGGGFLLLLPGRFSLFPTSPFGTLLLSNHHDVFISGCGVGVTVLDVTNSINDGFPGITIGENVSYLTLTEFTITDFSSVSEVARTLQPYIRIGQPGVPPTNHVWFDRLEFASQATTGPRGAVSGEYIQFFDPTPISIDHWTINRCLFTYPDSTGVSWQGITAQSTAAVSLTYFRFEGNTLDSAPTPGPWPTGAFLATPAGIPTWGIPDSTWKNNDGTDLGFVIATPPLPAVGTPAVNTSPWRVRVYIHQPAARTFTETITDVKGTAFLLPTPEAQFQLEPGESITFGGVVPTAWKWYGID